MIGTEWFSSLVYTSNQQLAVIYLLVATALIILVVALLLLSQAPSKMNWYEQNIIDLSAAKTTYVHKKAFNRCDTEEDREAVSSYELARRKQSRIRKVTQGSSLDCGKRSPPSPYRGSSPRGRASLPPPGTTDLSDSFTIPRAQKVRDSMFSNPHQSQFDRGLYQCNMPDSESNCDETSIAGAGSIKLSLSHDANLNLLTVHIQQAIDVPSKRQDGNPNPYFRVALDIPDSSEAKVEQQTQVYKSTKEPTINEEFYFQTPCGTNAIGACRLEVMVYDYDQFSVDECVGYCWLTLGRVSISNEKETPTVFWAEVLPFDENGGKGFGEVLFSLSYLSKAQRLSMNVFKARNLLVRQQAHGGSFATRVTLLDNAERRLKRKKTSAKKNAKNAQYNESLNFSVPKNALCESILEIEAVHEYGTFGMATEVLGKMELPLHKCKELWRAIIREEKSQARWYALEEP